MAAKINVGLEKICCDLWLIIGLPAVLIVPSPFVKAGDDVPKNATSAVASINANIKTGESLFSQTCSACHGGEGRGGKAPCLSCGKFLRSGNTDDGIYNTIANGLPMTKMGNYSSTLSPDQIKNIIAYLRWTESERVRAGEISTNLPKDQKPLVFPK